MLCGLPRTGIVCLYTVTPAGGESEISELAKCFSKAGYDVRVKTNATLEDLRTIPAGCSVFFFNTHGIYSSTNGHRVFFALQTGTEVTDDSAYASEQKAGLVGQADGTDLHGNPKTYLTITHEFIRHHWHFEDNSFVFINGCHAFDDGLGNKSIWRTILGKCNASVYAGWTQANVANCSSANLYLFDRLLGSNFPMARQEYPPQRPFDLESVYQKLSSLGLTDVLVNREDGKQVFSRLRIERSGRGDFGILAPSIEYVEIDEAERRVSLTGFFGADQTNIRVFIRETPEKVSSGGDFELIREATANPCQIMCSGLADSGPASAGYLVAAVDYGNGCLVESNPVPITAWNGKISFSLRIPGEDPTGVEIGKVTGDVFLRGDIHKPRTEPGGALKNRYCVFARANDQQIRPDYTSKGKYIDMRNMYSYTWHGSGSMAPPEKGVFSIVGWHRHPFDPVHPRLFVTISTTEGQTLIDVRDKDERVIVKDLLSPINTVYLANENPPPFGQDFLQGSLNWSETGGSYEGSYDIPEKQIERPVVYPIVSADEKFIVGRLSWETLKARFAPDDSTPG